MYGLQRFGWKLRLDTMERLLNELGNPQDKFLSVHVGGTNGKGSVCCFVSSVLKEAGYRVGVYTSPHLHKFNERIVVDDDLILDEEIISLVAQIKEVCEHEKLAVTFFEFTTALAFLHFAKRDIDIGVIEVGLGGKLDATNVIDPIVTCLTNVGSDHAHYLGNTLLERFEKKAGIIKGGVLITGVDQPELISRLRDKCLVKNTRLVIPRAAKVVESYESGQRVLIGKSVYPIQMLGEHQAGNLRLARSILDELKGYGLILNERMYREGFWKAKWDGRLQLLQETPRILVDGAHNLEGLNEVEKHIEQFDDLDVLIFALSKDKPEEMIRICKRFKHVIVTEGVFKPMDCVELSKKIPGSVAVKDVKEAVKMGLDMQKGTMLICGSLYMIGDAIKAVEKNITKSNIN